MYESANFNLGIRCILAAGFNLRYPRLIIDFVVATNKNKPLEFSCSIQAFMWALPTYLLFMKEQSKG